MSNIHFLVEKCILLKKKDVSNFFLPFNVIVTSQSDVPIFGLLGLEKKLCTMNSSWLKHVLFDQL